MATVTITIEADTYSKTVRTDDDEAEALAGCLYQLAGVSPYARVAQIAEAVYRLMHADPVDTPTHEPEREIEMTSTIHWTGDNWEELINFVGNAGTVGPQPGRPTFAEISTLAGPIVAEPGDRIIRDEQGRLGNLGQRD